MDEIEIKETEIQVSNHNLVTVYIFPVRAEC